MAGSREPRARTHRGSTRHRSAPRSNRATRAPRSQSPRRLVALFTFFAFAFVALAAKLVSLQIVDAPAYARLAADQRERVIEFPARRGAILDREGEPLAISVDLHMVYTDHIHVTDEAETAAALAPILDQPAPLLEQKLQPSSPDDQFEFLARQVQPRVARKIRALRLPGIYMRPEPKRFYPGGRLASHVLGFVDIDGEGLEGIEGQYDRLLQGRPGRMVLEQDPAGRPLPQAKFTYERPRPGRTLLLTLDKELQYFTELTLAEAVRAYSADAGTAMVMRPDTGEVLALANVPDFNPNAAGDSAEVARRNRAVTDVYEPGSAFKIVTVAGALEEGVVTPRSTFVVPYAYRYSDRVFHDSHTHPTETMSVTEIIEQSSNVGTIQVGLRLGGKGIDHYVRRFGFGSKTGLDFPGESPGLVLPRSEWSGSTVATIPIGQGIAVTPLQMMAAYGAVANGGRWVEPKLLHATVAPSGETEPASRPASRRIMSRATARKVTKMLTGVVERGTGIEAQIPGFAVAGKTGTAQKPLPTGGYGNSYVASFAGFAPARRPAIVAMVVLDEPSPIWGGATAAPTFKMIAEFALQRLGIAPTGNAERAAREIEAERSSDPAAHD